MISLICAKAKAQLLLIKITILCCIYLWSHTQHKFSFCLSFEGPRSERDKVWIIICIYTAVPVPYIKYIYYRYDRTDIIVSYRTIKGGYILSTLAYHALIWFVLLTHSMFCYFCIEVRKKEKDKVGPPIKCSCSGLYQQVLTRSNIIERWPETLIWVMYRPVDIIANVIV